MRLSNELNALFAEPWPRLWSEDPIQGDLSQRALILNQIEGVQQLALSSHENLEH